MLETHVSQQEQTLSFFRFRESLRTRYKSLHGKRDIVAHGIVLFDALRQHRYVIGQDCPDLRWQRHCGPYPSV